MANEEVAAASVATHEVVEDFNDGLANGASKSGLKARKAGAGAKTAASDFEYCSGFGNHVSSEALPGALPKRGNSARLKFTTSVRVQPRQIRSIRVRDHRAGASLR